MANVTPTVTVKIQFGVPLQYDPSPFVQPGDFVQFLLVAEDPTDSATVSFAPFSNPIQLNSTHSSVLQWVPDAAMSGQYKLIVNVTRGGMNVTRGNMGEALRRGGNHEVRTGDLDVTTEPPAPPRK